MKDRDFLVWVLRKLSSQGFPDGADYMTKLASIIDRTHPNQKSANIASAARVRDLIENG